MRKREKDTFTVEKCIPKAKVYWDTPDVVSLYGCRPSSNADLWFLSPWEFTQWWKPVQLKPPSRWYPLTEWAEDADRERAQPGVDFFLRDSTLKKNDPWVVFFPVKKNAGDAYEKQRHTW